MSESRTLKHGGIWELLRIAMPLIMASSSHAMRLFSDRIMLAQLSSEALAASLSAGLMSFMFMSFFLGVVNYTSTFVAQYTGAKRPHQVGPAVWQGFFLAPTSVTVLGTEERTPGEAYFRCQMMGDTSHLLLHNEPVSVYGYFTDPFQG